MADLSITATSVINVDAPTDLKLAAEAITAGQPLYAASSTTVGKADNDAAGKTQCIGLALNGGAAGQPIQYAKTGGNVTVNAVGTALAEVYVSDTAGGLCLAAGVTTGMRKYRVGYFTTTTNLVLDFKDYGTV